MDCSPIDPVCEECRASLSQGSRLRPAAKLTQSHHTTSIAITRSLIARSKMHSLKSNRDAAECGFIWSTGLDTFQMGSNGFVHRSAGLCFSNLVVAFTGPRRMIAAACASGTQAIGEAFRLIQNGRVDACVAGGSSVMLTPFYLIGFAGLQAVAVDNGDDPSLACRPFDKRRKGFALADGAGAMVLETLGQCAKTWCDDLRGSDRIRHEPGRLRSQSTLR